MTQEITNGELWEQVTIHRRLEPSKRTYYMDVRYVHNKYALVTYEHDFSKKAFYSVKDKEWISNVETSEETKIIVERIVTGKNVTKRTVEGK